MEVVNAVGRRKAAVARVYVKPGKGNITINQKPLDTYFPLEIFQYVVKQPLLVTSTTENFDITITLDGGGIKGQAEAAAWVSPAPSAKSMRRCARYSRRTAS